MYVLCSLAVLALHGLFKSWRGGGPHRGREERAASGGERRVQVSGRGGAHHLDFSRSRRLSIDTLKPLFDFARMVRAVKTVLCLAAFHLNVLGMRCAGSCDLLHVCGISTYATAGSSFNPTDDHVNLTVVT